MRVEKLTETRLEKLVAPEGKAELLVWERSGLGVRVGLKRRTFLVQYRNAAGRTRRLALGHWPAMSLPSARAKAAEVLARVERGEDPAAEASQRDEVPTLRAFSERYLAQHARPHKRPRSVLGDEWLLKKVILPALGDLRLDAIGRREVQRLHAHMADRPTLANRAKALLSTVFHLAEEWGEIPVGSNPAQGIRRYRETPRERFLSEAELARLGEALRAHEGKYPLAVAAVRLLVFTGARKSEIVALRWAEVDLAGATLRLPAERTKEKKPKTLPLSPPALEVFAKLPRLDDVLVFPGIRPGRPLRGGVEVAWSEVRRAAGLDGVHLHDLRHGFASCAVAGGLGLPILGALLGHTQPSTTARYAHLSADPLRAASDWIGARLAATLNGREPAEVVELHRSA
jgi:integrase